jgi:PAS domain S-box-containing protein
VSAVLVVDDREANLLYMQALLRGHGFDVVVARHGVEALELARAAAPDLVVSDLLMPVMDGYSLLREWKEDEELRAVPFIVHTATYTHPEDEQLAWDLGADDFVRKPAEPEELLRHIREVLGRRDANVAVGFREGPAVETGLLKAYSESLIRKLEEKTLELEASNRQLQQDIEKRRLVELRLEEQARLLDQTQDAMVVHDTDGRVLFWNKGAERLHGWTAQKAVGRRIAELYCPDTSQVEAALERLDADGEWSGELKVVNRRGDELIVESRWTLLPSTPGGRRSILASHTDVTDRKRLEAQFLRAQRSESIGTLAGGLAHDLNNLLAPILTGAALLRQRPHDDEDDEILDAIEVSARRGRDLVRQVLAFTLGVRGDRVPVRVAEVLAEAASMASMTFPRAVVVKTDVAEDLWDVVGDATQLHQVVLNLLVNARDAVQDRGTIVVRARNETLDEPPPSSPELAPGHYVVLTVQDDGVGMAPELVGRIFEPFLTTKERGEGSGLGLSTVLGIVKSHGGTIGVTSEPGVGTTFEIHLPAPDLTGTPTPPRGAAQDTARPGSGELILVVDDEELIVAMTRRILEAGGYRVATAANGDGALRSFLDLEPDVAAVLTDLEMPEMDGSVLIDALRTLDPDVPIIVTSGGLRASGDGPTGDRNLSFLPKPSTPDQLLAELSRVLASRSGSGAAPPA